MNRERTILLCTDLDRTILPNGWQDESPQARFLLSRLKDNKNFKLAYVTGRNRELINEAMEKFYIPEPDYAIGDVGASIYEIQNGNWQEWGSWRNEIKKDWKAMDNNHIIEALSVFPELELQEDAQQHPYKVSYYVEAEHEKAEIIIKVKQHLDERNIASNIIWSFDDKRNAGLLDVLPFSANKDHAIRYIMKKNKYSISNTVFAGDSGNDIAALTSGLQSVLVKNAQDEVKEEVQRIIKEKKISRKVYMARGDYLGMNGNYSAGVLEGMVHFIPELHSWLLDSKKK